MQNKATDALTQAAAVSRGGGPATRLAYTEFLTAHHALDKQGCAEWWAQRALEEEEQQLQALSRALPRGGRVAPQLLDTFIPVTPGPIATIFQHLVTALDAPRGLAEALRLRGSARGALAITDPHSVHAFALRRLDQRMEDVLRLWFSPGFLRVEERASTLLPDVPAAAGAAGAAVAGAGAGNACPLDSMEPSSVDYQRCYVLSHPQMECGGAGPPLFVAHASLLQDLPASLAEATRPPPMGRPPRTACLWALEVPPGEEAVHGLGLGQMLRREASQRLRSELAVTSDVPPDVPAQGPAVGALVPLRGFAAWLRAQGASSRGGLQPELAEALRRAVQGPSGVRADEREVSFVDEDGDSILFRLVALSEGHAGAVLEASAGGAPPCRVSRLRAADSGRALRFVMEPGAEALQVNAPQDVVARGDIARASQLAHAAGLLPAELHDHVLHLAYEYITRRAADGKSAADADVHFHLMGGASLHALHWRADESAKGLSESLGVMASFLYGGEDKEAERMVAYSMRGLDAADVA